MTAVLFPQNTKSPNSNSFIFLCGTLVLSKIKYSSKTCILVGAVYNLRIIGQKGKGVGKMGKIPGR